MISDLQTVAEYLPPSPPSKTLSVSHDVFEGDTTLVDQNTPAAALSQAKQDSRPQLAQLPDDISMISLADHPFCALVSEAPLDSQVWDPPNNWESKYWTVLSQLEDAQARIALTEQLEHLASTVDPTAFGPRDNIIALRRKYDRLIQYTLTTRREAREWKKMAIYWEARARQGEASRGKLPSDSITPSASDVSEVAEPLTPERIKAVENLLRRRRGSILVETGSTRESVLERIGQALHSASTSSHSIQSAASSSSSSSDSTVRATSSTPTATTRSSSIVHDDFEPASSSPNSGLLLGVLSSQPLGDISNSAHNRPASLLKAPNQKIVGRMSSLGAAHQVCSFKLTSTNHPLTWSRAYPYHPGP